MSTVSAVPKSIEPFMARVSSPPSKITEPGQVLYTVADLTRLGRRIPLQEKLLDQVMFVTKVLRKYLNAMRSTKSFTEYSDHNMTLNSISPAALQSKVERIRVVVSKMMRSEVVFIKEIMDAERSKGKVDSMIGTLCINVHRELQNVRNYLATYKNYKAFVAKDKRSMTLSFQAGEQKLNELKETCREYQRAFREVSPPSKRTQKRPVKKIMNIAKSRQAAIEDLCRFGMNSARMDRAVAVEALFTCSMNKYRMYRAARVKLLRDYPSVTAHFLTKLGGGQRRKRLWTTSPETIIPENQCGLAFDATLLYSYAERRKRAR